MTALDDLRFQRQVQHLHALGPRPVGELLDALATALDGHDELDRLLAGYDRLSPETVRALGADRFPRPVPREVPRELLTRSAA